MANLIDGYSDKELKTIDDALSKNSTDPTEPLAVEFLGNTKNCVTGSAKTAVIDQLKAAFPDMTADQLSCVEGIVNSKTAADFQEPTAIGQEVGTKCLA